MMTKNIKQPDPVPQSGIDEAVELMQSGKVAFFQNCPLSFSLSFSFPNLLAMSAIQ